MGVIVLEDIVKQFTMGDTILQALDHVNFSVEEGDFVAIMGPSGSGKSTMMNILGCLDRPTSGKYYLDGKEVAGLSATTNWPAPERQNRFCVPEFQPAFQDFGTAECGAASGVCRRVGRGTDGTGPDRPAGCRTEDRLDHKPNEPSGGQRQRGGHRPGADQ